MNTDIIKQFPLSEGLVDKEHYMQSLLEQALQLNLISRPQFEKLQMQTVRLLEQQLDRYTHGESSSVLAETAQSIMQSVFYGINHYLKSLPGIEECLTTLTQTDPAILYTSGRKQIQLQVEQAKKRFEAVKASRIATNNEAYNQTIDHAFSEFFGGYDTEFSAHEATGMIDYPLCIDKMQTTGIEYIDDYLEKLNIENLFCKAYAQEDIDHLLRSYDERYSDLLINIFELVLINSLGASLLKRDSKRIDLSPADCGSLVKQLTGLSSKEYTAVFEDAKRQLLIEIGDENNELKQYISTALSVFSIRLDGSLRNHRADALFTPFKEVFERECYQFSDGEKMDNDLFKTVTDEIRECREISDKLAIIRSSVHSFGDLVDILGSYCIFDDEYYELFGSFEELELALLLKIQPEEAEETFHLTEAEKDWQRRFSDYLASLDKKRLQRVTELAQQMKI